jgi:O-antigen ligase
MILFKYPEIYYTLFLTAGIYKADSRLEAIQQRIDLTVIFGFLSILGTIFNIYNRQIKFVIPTKQVIFPYSIIIFLGTISLLYTPAPIYGTDKFLRFLTITSLALFLPFFLFQSEKAIRRFFIMFIILAISMVIDIFSGGLKPNEISFVAAFSSNYLALGRILGIAVIIVFFYFAFSVRNVFAKLTWSLLIPIFMFGLFISGGRGPAVAGSLSILTIVLYESFNLLKNSIIIRKIKKDNLESIFFICVIIIITVFLIIYFHDYFATIFYRLELLYEGESKSAIIRLMMIEKAIESTLSFPKIITGLGIGGFSVYFAGFDDIRGEYPHNIFLEVGSELGIFGLIAIVYLIFSSFLKIIYQLNSEKVQKKYLYYTLLSLLIFMSINSSVSGDINDNRLLFTIIGIIHATNENKK